MCGLAGTYNWDETKADSDVINRMLEKLRSRGPDGVGVFQQNNISLGHRRLKIMDLSESAHQPMLDSNLGLALAFNGAIYNYPALKRELENKGYQFFSNSDTEVILKGYHCWGEKLLNKLNGMFAFAIWARESNQLFIARDRLGIKPLYYSLDKNQINFASTLPSLLEANVETKFDTQALHHYFSFHSVIPGPLTLFEGIKKLPPASYMTIEANGHMKLEKYWSLSYERTPQEEAYSLQDWKSELLTALTKSVNRRMLADVPVGVLLSGGIDSSLVVALLREHGVERLSTFSIGFNSHSGEEGNEFKYSNEVASLFNTDHHRYLIGTLKLIDVLPETIAAMSEPMMSHDCIGFYLLSQAVAQHCKVVQSGQGADEIFAGYHWYQQVEDSTNPFEAYRNAFFDRKHAEIQQLFEHKEWFSEDFSTELIKKHFQTSGAQTGLDRALRCDTTVMLVDDPVKRIDNMTMAWGLEARVPFLDHEVVELSAKIPSKYKLPNNGKYILKELARDWLPASIIDRPKGYFPVPELKYITGSVLEFVKEVLSQPAAQARGLFNQQVIQSYLDAPKEHITPLNGSKLWQVAVLESWLQTNNL